MGITQSQRHKIRLTVLGLSALALLIVWMFVRQFMNPEHLDPQWLQMHGTVLFDTPRSFDTLQLRDQDDQPFDGTAFGGSWNVVFFGFTFCPDVCPTTLGLLGEVQQALKPATDGRAPLAFYMVSVDPARDTPAKLKPYLEHFSSKFTGLTGEFSAIHRFATQLNIPFRKVMLDDTNYSVDHSASLVLINPRGHYAGYMTPPFDKERMVRVLEVLRTRSS
ncbi:MAG: SCO family protein [Pseudomonadales bacterium]|nr:SCO family protein [Pseudomonadales bacterium]